LSEDNPWDFRSVHCVVCGQAFASGENVLKYFLIGRDGEEPTAPLPRRSTRRGPGDVNAAGSDRRQTGGMTGLTAVASISKLGSKCNQRLS
jgi:hypothetical protein